MINRIAPSSALRAWVVAALVLLSAQANATPMVRYHPPELHPGEKLILEVRFPSPPETSAGVADMLFVNSGSVSIGVTGVRTSLYSGSTLIGSSFRSSAIAFGVFVETASAYGALGASAGDLSAIFSGAAHALIEVVPSFSNVFPDPFVGLQFTGIEAARSTGFNTFERADPAPLFVSARVVSVSAPVHPAPEPGTVILLLAGVVMLYCQGTRRSQ